MPTPEVPKGAVGEVARVLAATSHYQVLEVPHDAGAPSSCRHGLPFGYS